MTKGDVGRLISWRRGIARTIFGYDAEFLRVMKYVDRYGGGKHNKVLDVGCGYGRYLRPLHATGYSVLGVEANRDIVAKNLQDGLNCISVDEFRHASGEFDLIIMSHIVEHFPPNELKDFIDAYLDRLKVDGHLIIATPLLSPYFYDDFDHVKPYQLTGLLMVFGGDSAQVQYYARNRLKLADVWFRRSYFRFSHVRGKHIPSLMTRIYQITELFSAILCILSCGLIGKTDGWVGVFQKSDLP